MTDHGSEEQNSWRQRNSSAGSSFPSQPKACIEHTADEILAIKPGKREERDGIEEETAPVAEGLSRIK